MKSNVIELRQGKNVDIEFEVEGSVGTQQIAPLLFIPFLENSFKHGVNNHLTKKGFVYTKLKIEQEKVDLFITNSKPEIPVQHKHRRSGGIGLVNVHRRLNLLYPNQYNLDIEEQPDTYTVNLSINLV